MMLSLDTKVDLLARLGDYLISGIEEWTVVKERAISANAWFTLEHIDFAAKQIVNAYLQKDKLQAWAAKYPQVAQPKAVGIVMAGNIPLVGFHDFLCGFVSGNNLFIKLS